MTRIYLIRHASPRVEPGNPASGWRLSPAGIEEANALAEIARPWGIDALYSSVEPKAQSTAGIIGDALAIPVHIAEGFEEQHWDDWVENADAFNDAVRRILEQPDDRMNGSESAAAAAARFGAALRSVIGEPRTDAALRFETNASADATRRSGAAGTSALAVVSHGRVLTAWLARAVALESALEVWRAMPMPAYCSVEFNADGRVRLLEPFHGLPSSTH